MNQPQWLAQLMDPLGHDRTPAENPNSVSRGAPGFDRNVYSPPTYGDDIAASGVQRQPLSGLLTQAEPLPEQNGMGGPLSNAHDIIPNAPQGPSQQELDAQHAREAIARARAGRGEPVLDPNSDWRWRLDRTNLDRLQERASADQAELQRRESTPFESFWHYGGRQSEEWQPGQDPFYRFSQLPADQRTPGLPRRSLASNRPRR